jgi:hypothetical protein
LLAFVQIAWLKHLNNRLDAKYGRVQEEVNIEDEIGNETESSTNFRFIL